MKNTEGALKWIVGILNDKKIPFQIAGGFAARLYGSTRELADIDIDIPDEAFGILFPYVEKYIIYGPEHYVDEYWNLQLMTLKFEGQEIDLAGEVKIFDSEQGQWVLQKTDFINSTMMNMYDMVIPVIPKDALVEYKKKLMREVDRDDIRQLGEHK